MFEIHAVDGVFLRVDPRGNCFDALGHTVYGDCLVCVKELKSFLDLPEDTCFLNSGESVLSPALKPSYKKSKINSVVVFESWHEETTLALALLKRGADGGFACDRLCQQTEAIPQCFWEVMHSGAHRRAVAKVRSRFFFDNVPLWYFVGRKTKTLYVVCQEGAIIPCCEKYDSEGRNRTRELGILDGLSQDEFRKAGDDGGFDYFTSEALVGTVYQQRKLETPGDILFMGRCSADVEGILNEFLTAEEIMMTREVESNTMWLENEYMV